MTAGKERIMALGILLMLYVGTLATSTAGQEHTVQVSKCPQDGERTEILLLLEVG